MKRIIDRPILLVVVFALAALGAMFGPGGVTSALAIDPMHSGVEILVFDDDQVTLEMQDGGEVVIGDLKSYQDGIRCEIPTLACTRNISLEYRDGDRLVKIDSTFVALDPNGNESLATTFGTHESLVVNQSIGGDVEQTSGTFRATFTANRDGTLQIAFELTHVAQSPVTITIYDLPGAITVY